MKLTATLTTLALALSAGCVTAPEDTDPTDEATAETDSALEAEVIGPGVFTVTPIIHPAPGGFQYRGALQGPQPASCGGGLNIGHVFRLDPSTGRFVEVILTACTQNLRGTLQRAGQGFDLFLR